MSIEQELKLEATTKARNAAYNDMVWSRICSVVVDGKVLVDNEANWREVFNWPHEDQGEVLSESLFREILNENPDLKKSLVWERIRSQEQRQREEALQLRRDEDQFSGFCRRHLISECQANFSLWRNAESFEGLALATQSELLKWENERISARNEYLVSADPATLRSEVRKEAEQQRAASAQQQQDDQLKASQERDSHLGYPVLPKTWQGQTLDAAFIKNCSVETQKFLSKRFGSAQLTARLRGQP